MKAVVKTNVQCKESSVAQQRITASVRHYALAGAEDHPLTVMAPVPEEAALTLDAGVAELGAAASVAVASGTPALDKTALASAGVKVSVVLTDEPVAVGDPELRASWPRTSRETSMKAMVGPATSLSVA